MLIAPVTLAQDDWWFHKRQSVEQLKCTLLNVIGAIFVLDLV